MLFQLVVAIIFSVLIKWYLDNGFDIDFWLGVLAFCARIIAMLLILEKLVALMNIF